MWMVDAYTTMANYPYSERQSLSKLTGTSREQGQSNTQINYIRNSVKATVDAYTGKVTLYQWEKSDPVLKSWMNVFPGLVKPGNMGSQMPKDVLNHVRYPEDLFNVQRSLLAQYHISNPVASYNGNGKWQVPSDPFQPNAGPQPAYYVLANNPATPDTNSPQFQLTTPLTVNGANNLAAYMSADSDPGPNYGKLTVLKVPGKSNIQGPAQVANVFKSESVISRDINLLDNNQTAVQHGNLLTLPLGDSFLYVEPLYVQSTRSQSSYPTLQRVLVTYGNEKGYASNLATALADLKDGAALGSHIEVGQTSNGASGPVLELAPSLDDPAAHERRNEQQPVLGQYRRQQQRRRHRRQRCDAEAAADPARAGAVAAQRRLPLAGPDQDRARAGEGQQPGEAAARNGLRGGVLERGRLTRGDRGSADAGKVVHSYNFGGRSWSISCCWQPSLRRSRGRACYRRPPASAGCCRPPAACWPTRSRSSCWRRSSGICRSGWSTRSGPRWEPRRWRSSVRSCSASG